MSPYATSHPSFCNCYGCFNEDSPDYAIPDEADVCGCESKYCTDCAFAHLRVTVTKVGCDHGLWPAYICRVCYPPDPNQRLWIAYYRLKRWLFKPTPWSRR